MYARLLGPIAALALLIPGVGAAGPGRLAAARNPHLAQAKALYQDLEYEQALGRLEKALAWKGTSPAERVDIYVYTGLCRYQMGDEKGARVAFREALQMDTRAALPRLTSPKIQRVFQQESELLASAAPPRPPPEPEPIAEAPPEPDPGRPPSGGLTGRDDPDADLVPDTRSARERRERDRERDRDRGRDDSGEESFWQAHWPSIVAGGAAVLLGGAGLAMGLSAKSQAETAVNNGNAIQARKQNEDAKSAATTANVLYAASGVAAAAGVVFAFTF